MFLLIGSVLTFINGKYIKATIILGYIISMALVGLGALGIIDRNGILEHWANEFISMYSGMPLEELEKLEGTTDDIGQLGEKNVTKEGEQLNF